MKRFKLYNILWDKDRGDKTVLPKTAIAELDSNEEESDLSDILSDWLSDQYGYCHSGFLYYELPPVKDLGKKTVEIAKHMVGLDYETPYIRHGRHFYKPFRNFFVTGGENDPDTKSLETLSSEGFATVNKCGDRAMYALTKEGFDWLGNTLGITIRREIK